MNGGFRITVILCPYKDKRCVNTYSIKETYLMKGRYRLIKRSDFRIECTVDESPQRAGGSVV